MIGHEVVSGDNPKRRSAQAAAKIAACRNLDSEPQSAAQTRTLAKTEPVLPRLRSTTGVPGSFGRATASGDRCGRRRVSLDGCRAYVLDRRATGRCDGLVRRGVFAPSASAGRMPPAAPMRCRVGLDASGGGLRRPWRVACNRPRKPFHRPVHGPRTQPYRGPSLSPGRVPRRRDRRIPRPDPMAETTFRRPIR